MNARVDHALLAFRRLLSEAASGGQTKVDALVALTQRTVIVPTWTPYGDDFRPLLSSDGQNALPLFTSMDQLEEAARRFGWMQPDGSVPHQEVGSRAAFRHALANRLQFIVLDITAAHALEVAREEIEPLLDSRSHSDSAGAFAAVGRISDQMLKAVRPSSVPAAAPTDVIPAPAMPSNAVMAPISSGPPSSNELLAALTPAPAAPDTSVPLEIIELTAEPNEAVLDSITEVLRGFPEVEWAAFAMARRGQASPAPVIGLRIDTNYRARVVEVFDAVQRAGARAGLNAEVLLLDEKKLVQSVRANSIVFFPWRRRS
ncbi:MAG: SseB family protein [Polyangiales bacterium]